MAAHDCSTPLFFSLESQTESLDGRAAGIGPASLLSRLGHSPSRKRNPKVHTPICLCRDSVCLYVGVHIFVCVPPIRSRRRKMRWGRGGRPVGHVWRM